jgi:hypothetical protein
MISEEAVDMPIRQFHLQNLRYKEKNNRKSGIDNIFFSGGGGRRNICTT